MPRNRQGQESRKRLRASESPRRGAHSPNPRRHPDGVQCRAAPVAANAAAADAAANDAGASREALRSLFAQDLEPMIKKDRREREEAQAKGPCTAPS